MNTQTTFHKKSVIERYEGGDILEESCCFAKIINIPTGIIACADMKKLQAYEPIQSFYEM